MINIFLCFIGILFIVIVVNSFVILGNLGEGGFIGFLLILNYILGILFVFSFFIINVILIIVGWKFFSRMIVIYIVIIIIVSLIFFDLIYIFGLGIYDNFINLIFVGLMLGIGFGLVIIVYSILGGIFVIVCIILKYSEMKML